MYDELVRRLWECASGECFNCSQYTETTNASVCSKELMKQAANAIEDLSEQLENETEYATALNSYVPQWIPVTERLPEPDEEVLVCNEEYGLSELGFAMVAVWDGADWIETWNRSEAIYCITHWMPLPDPPKGE